MSWLPEGFVAPTGLEVPSGHHLRPIRATDIDLDYPAVMGSQPRLWEIFGAAWGWPPTTMTREQDLDDLVRHADEAAANLSFNYAMFDRDETALLGCVYVDPPEKVDADVEVSWWVIDAEIGGELEACVRAALKPWIASAWPFRAPRFIGDEISWDDYLALPDRE